MVSIDIYMIPATFTTNNDRTSRLLWQAFPETYESQLESPTSGDCTGSNGGLADEHGSTAIDAGRGYTERDCGARRGAGGA